MKFCTTSAQHPKFHIHPGTNSIRFNPTLYDSVHKTSINYGINLYAHLYDNSKDCGQSCQIYIPHIYITTSMSCSLFKTPQQP